MYIECTVCPDLDDLADEGQALFPLLDGGQERPNEAAPRHALQVHGIIVQVLQDLVHRAQDGASLLRAFKVTLHGELHVLPRVHHLLHTLYEKYMYKIQDTQKLRQKVDL